MRTRSVLVLVALVAIVAPAVLLAPASVVGFPTEFHPYQHDPPTYAVAHESTVAFERAVDDADLAVDEAVSVDELSPDARAVFEAALDNPRADVRGVSGWQTTHVTVCREGTLVCDEYSTPPEFPPHGTLAPDSKTSESLTVVERGDDRYVVTVAYFHAGNMLSHIVSVLTTIGAVAYWLLFARFAARHTLERSAVTLGLAVIGATLVLWPSLVVLLGIAAYWWLALPYVVGGTLAIPLVESRIRGGTLTKIP